AGAPGLLLGGYLGDMVLKKRRDGRLLVAAIFLAVSVPFIFIAFDQPPRSMVMFLIFFAIGMAAMYVYYSTVYSAIQDVIEPSLRGTAMAIYFFAMYLLGASLGPYGTGLLSDLFTTRAARAAGVIELTQPALEPFRAAGLHSAMYVIPILSVLLALVLFAASRTVQRDVENLDSWMRSNCDAA